MTTNSLAGHHGQLHSAIISLLRRYGKPLPVGFLARSVGVSTEIVSGCLVELQERGVLEVRHINGLEEASLKGSNG